MPKQISEIFRKTTTRIKSIAFHPTNPVIITAHHCGTIYIWNVLYQQIVAVLREHQGSVRCVKIHPYGEIFATAGDDKIIRVWNYKTRQVVQTMKGHTDYIRCIDFHPTKPWIISASDDCTIKIWNYYTGEQLSSSSGHTHYVMAVLFLDSNHILTGSLDHTIGLWNCSNLFEKKKFMVPDVILRQSIDAHDRGVNCLYLSNEYVMSGSDDREIKIWKFQNETLGLEKTLYSHEGNVISVFCDNGNFFGGGEDNILSEFSDGKSTKHNIDSRVWSIAGRDDYLAIGTDDGLILYRKSFEISFCEYQNNIFYSISNVVKKYNMKQSVDYCRLKRGVTNMFMRDSILYALYDGSFEMFEDERRIGGDVGSIAFVEGDKYQLKEDGIYKNDEMFRSGIKGMLVPSTKGLFIVNNRTFTLIIGDQEYSATFNFSIRSVKSNNQYIVLVGVNKILFLDYSLQLVHSINELVEITGGVFHEDIFIYATVKQLKFFLEDVGVLQSIESYMVPVLVQNDYLLVLGCNEIEKILLNMSEIRFRKAVLNDSNILSVIEEEQLPGLSPLEYLIKKNKGGIALPFIKDEDKRFQLFMNDKNYEEALRLCSNNRMFEELAFHSLKNGCYDMAETCFKRIQDYVSLFYLFLSTKQLDKLKELEGEEIENMVKIIFEDRSIFESSKNVQQEGKTQGVAQSGKYTDKIKLQSVSPEMTQDKAVISKSSKENILQETAEEENMKEEDTAENISEELSKNFDSISLSQKNETKDFEKQSGDDKARDYEEDNGSTGSNVRTDQATFNDSDFQSQIFDLSEIDLSEETRGAEIDDLYENALELTTQGKFSGAIEMFRECIALIALRISTPTDFSDLRRKIGNYLLGLHIEKSRRNIVDPERSIQMSLFFSNLELEGIHILLVKNLALTTCFKHGNLKTAYEIAEKFPDCKNSKKILSEKKGEDVYQIDESWLCYDTILPSKSFKECALCGVKSKEGELCQACKIGILH
ncbi:uncharacterized protein VICG_00309 [Vittaforma corneae ATCC 50505]|uniref:Coatomer alpha subunit C-terminal domain-containing protein n=1 Tax=Vittaforma corneae (strain ATCC 50505) TaxID=993615 RepID=L2GQF1_VITCO|nr:uncharacterized protein VICG_00309 [Vittaforma corneae ATCC 50505]ELA42557.1 hypothetical protein VICG_00309 [Vittaforma corneae ATCC 50505]